jgi:ABC-type transporter MlaC component
MNIIRLAATCAMLLTLFVGHSVKAETTAPDVLVKNTANEVLEILKSDVANSDMSFLQNS